MPSPTGMTASAKVPVITIADAAVFEGNSLTTVMPFAVRLSAPSAFTITVSYATVDGTAARNTDYTRIVSGTLTFAPGVSTQFVNVSINGDTQVETNETLFVTLSSGGKLIIRKPWPSMLRGIWGDPERYKQTYWSEVKGCYFTGDGAKLDDEGYLWLMGRVDDVMNVFAPLTT